ncbi:uncharacterized protein B0I36DRAFT_310842 [Microdochium trichocladiopsis]|uniref:ER membrane protein complex subunit 10 n=1 Tax=Microdochium trichocladiopsis TaxID=1682393 RepID=A0A9P8YIA0_9PEZI|nr:uncharacterized protein B0I36DRAFT_310842 [Microdochium trichocladiopsis]KAH7040507.1 hypothetical protein B0I36DRAFT_310842 [Microdochium trichocladiopsis]
MKLSTSLVSTASLLLAAASSGSAASSTSARKANVYIQPVATTSGAAPPQLLAEIQYDPFFDAASGSAASTRDASTNAAASILSYEAPEFDADGDDDDSGGSGGGTLRKPKLLRIGVWDPSTATWASSTSVASAENFGKGYSPQIMLSVDARSGDVVGAALRGVRIDAGQTRDFGPKAVLLVDSPGKQPDLNKPVVLAPNGKKVEPVPEKTLLQKYWWVLAAGVLLAMSGGGEGGK